MGNPKSNPKPWVPSHPGTRNREAGGNKGKQMQVQGGEKPQVIQTKGH
ncbi:acid-soluble spore protein N [Radiobacillus sp. PE A8.2]